MKVLVTGGAGYIGSVLVPMLLNKGHEVTVLDNLMFGQTPLLDVCNNKNLNIVRGDVRNDSLLKEQVTKADAIIPLAALVGAPLCDKDPIQAQSVNADAIKKIYDWKSKDQMMIYPCTNSGYGIGQEGIFCDEESPLKPISLYGKVKVEAESHILNGGEGVTFRFATLFGIAPRMRLDLLVNDFTYRAVNDRAVVLFEAHFKRNYLHVRDGARAFMHGLENYETMKGRPFNVGLSDANLTKEELCKVIQRHVPNFSYVISEIGEDPDKRNYNVSNKRIEDTGYKPATDLDDGIIELVKGFKIVHRNQFSNV